MVVNGIGDQSVVGEVGLSDDSDEDGTMFSVYRIEQGLAGGELVSVPVN